MISPCCKAEVRVASSRMDRPLRDEITAGTTFWYECVACGKPVDPIDG